MSQTAARPKGYQLVKSIVELYGRYIELGGRDESYYQSIMHNLQILIEEDKTNWWLKRSLLYNADGERVTKDKCRECQENMTRPAHIDELLKGYKCSECESRLSNGFSRSTLLYTSKGEKLAKDYWLDEYKRKLIRDADISVSVKKRWVDRPTWDMVHSQYEKYTR